MVDSMSNKKSIMGKIKKTSKKATHKAAFNPVIEIMARIGYAAHGLIYFVMGLLAIFFAFGKGGNTTDQQGAIATIGRLPEGRILLWLILIGLVCYILWCLIRTVLNSSHNRHETKGGAQRIGYLFSAMVYTMLAIPTYALITGGTQPAHNGAQEDKTQHYVAQLLAFHWGPWVVSIIGIIVIFVSLSQIYLGIKPDFEKQFHLNKLTSSQEKFVKYFGRVGIIARGIIFALIGVYLFIAGFTSKSSEVKGFNEALISLLHQPYGRWLIGCIALGLMALGIYSLFATLFFRLRK
jgi:hypothetical protein